VVGGTKANQGRLQIRDDYDRWSATCSRNWTPFETRVACRSLDYQYGGSTVSPATFGLYPPGPSGRIDSVPMSEM